MGFAAMDVRAEVDTGADGTRTDVRTEPGARGAAVPGRVDVLFDKVMGFNLIGVGAMDDVPRCDVVSADGNVDVDAESEGTAAEAGADGRASSNEPGMGVSKSSSHDVAAACKAEVMSVSEVSSLGIGAGTTLARIGRDEGDVAIAVAGRTRGGVVIDVSAW